MKHKKPLYTPKYHIPTFDETIANYNKQSTSKYPLRFMGSGNKDVSMREEDRDGNFHIIGTSGHGKSKYMEYHLRKDIDMGFGLCLLDGSKQAATFHAILEYCAYKNHKKVCIIDPGTLYNYGKIACIQPLDPRYATKSVQSAKDALNILFGSSIDNTPRIQDNLTSLFRMLTAQGLTLFESSYFTEYSDTRWRQILERSKDKLLADKFSTPGRWQSEFSTTITRLNRLRDEPINLMIGASEGIDFAKLIDEGWVILGNLSSPYMNSDLSRFLGILIIAQLGRAIEILNARKEGFGVKGKCFYLYIDEASKFATPQVSEILDFERKSGFRIIFAHHYISQIKNPEVRDSILTNTTNKMMFHIEQDEERLKMIKELRFGDGAKEANNHYRNLPRRKFICKVGKDNPIELEAPNIEPVPFENKFSTIESYIRERLQDPWYSNKGDIEDQIKSRIKSVDNGNDTPPNDTLPPVETTTPDSKTNSNTSQAKRETLLDRLQREADEFKRNNPNSKKNGK
jgi:hypothetical protein